MFNITVFIAANIQPIVLLYKGSDTLEMNVKLIESFDAMKMGGSAVFTGCTLEDDFGQKLKLIQQPAVILIQDMKQAREADVERGIFNALTQIKASKRAESEPEIVAARRSQMQSPSVLQPFGAGGGMPRQ